MRTRTTPVLVCLVIGLSVAPLGVRAATTMIAIEDFSFSPSSITIVTGSDIRWTYRVGDGTAPHTVTSEDSSWDSGNIAPGGGFTRSFARPGTYRYVCTYHPDLMTGVIHVEDARASTPVSGGVSVVATQQSDPGPRSQRASTSAASPQRTTTPSPVASAPSSAKVETSPTETVRSDDDAADLAAASSSGGDPNVLLAVGAFLLLAGMAGAITATLRRRGARPPA